ncbi:zinc finger bed domain-containing protein ricesleeper 2-like [Gigaspora margarita]|uniref:Zinc finger bed domain-containing protein ricesleeper 2-like n=1 Tax=Gigaspora margarita TaxID=4874 RepID=A0A8H4EQ58_GIGMA|nr:zinc finger bed domain-containing protein ricesleeper 2-like [Gigaspora margarita]
METALNLLAADYPLICSLYPSTKEQQKLKDILTLLEPIEAATKLLSATLYLTIDEIHLVFLNIQDFLNSYIGQEEFFQNMVAASIHQKLEEYWNIMDKSSIVSAILDPRTKLKIFNRTEVTNIKNVVQEIIDQCKD